VAELYCRRGEYKKALRYAEKALGGAIYDAGANYIYGVICRNLGRLVDAKEALGWAARSMKYRSGAYCQIAEICLLEGNFALAGQYCRRALDFNKYNIDAYQSLGITYRKLKQPEQARKALAELLAIEPLNHLARYELYLLEPGKRSLSNFQSMIRNELPHENYLEMAIYYVKLGFDAEAVGLLKYAPEYPTVYYWLGYLLREKLSTASKKYAEKGRGLSAKLVFPFREESVEVFQWACESWPSDWKAKYYLGLVYWSKGRVEEARELFADCGQPDFAAFYIARSHLYKESDAQRISADLEKAVAVDSKDWRNWHHLVSFYNERGMFDKALTLAQQAARQFFDEDKLTVELVRALVGNKRYGEALGILGEIEVLPYEGASEVHSLFVRCQIHLALEDMEKGNYRRAIGYIEKSKEYPEHLGSGRPYNPDFRLQKRLRAICRDNLGAEGKGGLELQLSSEVLELIEAMDNRK
jgi:tetratricopeptide (TPR) repeat protein